MSEMKLGPAARYFDDFEIGEQFLTQGRTISDVELTMWAMFSGDMNPFHIDDVYAKEHSLFGGRFPQGLMAVGIASGLYERMGLFVGTGLAMTGQTITYRKPVLVGDTIYVRLTVAGLRPHPRRPAGTVTFGYEIIDSESTVFVDGEWGILLASRAVNEAAQPIEAPPFEAQPNGARTKNGGSR
ncbi:MaoC/PaaZ C-terminal domain-containing protein [Salinibacterium sp. ZJ454]|uniref:MaoC/PaaZ C-terminal domain-containing protein n=1 Tax=Salinibacterium sp. ZJ454 TaxID=2708339 RepID=UPI00142087AC|nr:MaoC/PaaZ C-terminal domain-containing protein [Salinibacterium sp. ZJ454]